MCTVGFQFFLIALAVPLWASGISVSTEFEGGSGRVELLSPSHIRCEINAEADQNGRNRQPSWLYFRVDGVRGREITVDLTGFRGEYNYKPTDGLWGGHLHPAISYDDRHWEFVQDVEFDSAQSRLRFRVKPKTDSFWIARIPPYTNRHLARLLDEIHGNPNLKQESVGLTPKGRPIPLLTITDSSTPVRDKKIVWMMTRQHSWEAGTSWVGEGAIWYLLSDTSDARRLRANYVFRILPLCDPDGVARGGVRFNANGYDLNRNWDAVDEKLMPEIAAQKKAILKWIDDGNRIDLFLTIHNTESHDYIEGPVSAGGPAKAALIRRLWEGLHSKTSFNAPDGPRDMPSTTTPGMKGRMTVYQNLFSERNIPAVLIELMTERNPKLGREATIPDRIEFGEKLVQVIASALDDNTGKR